MSNRAKAAKVVGGESYVTAPADVIDARLMGQYDLGAAGQARLQRRLHAVSTSAAKVNMPRKAHGIWFMSQYVRFGYLPQAPDYRAVADELIMDDLYTKSRPI
jgi:nitrate/nitrite transport system substrate-binding protein